MSRSDPPVHSLSILLMQPWTRHWLAEYHLRTTWRCNLRASPLPPHSYRQRCFPPTEGREGSAGLLHVRPEQRWIVIQCTACAGSNIVKYILIRSAQPVIYIHRQAVFLDSINSFTAALSPKTEEQKIETLPGNSGDKWDSLAGTGSAPGALHCGGPWPVNSPQKYKHTFDVWWSARHHIFPPVD